jgi:hypothetical protein
MAARDSSTVERVFLLEFLVPLPLSITIITSAHSVISI